MKNLVEFKLFAPYNKNAALIGSFSDWKEIPLEKGEDGHFRTKIELEDGVYQYKFRIQSKSWNFEPDQWVEVIDPYATNVDTVNQNGVVRIKDGKQIVDTYVWQHDDKPLPNNHELVIYELHISDFSGGEGDSDEGGKFKDVVEKLDYLSELGINAIELMPVNEYPGDYNWGYKVRHFFATESSYGSTEGLKQLIDECHARGIRVFMDGIYNHTDEECPLLLIDRDYWYYHDRHHPDQPASDYWGPEFNYEHYDKKLDIRPAWKYIADVVRFWIQEYHIDGIRYDAVRQIDNYDFFYWITQEAKKAAGAKPFYNIGEYIPETTDLTVPTGPMDGCWHYSFHHYVVEHIDGSTFDLENLKQVLEPKRQGYPAGVTNIVNYLASHDLNHLMAELGDRGIFGEAAFKRAKLAAVLLMTAVGVPMIWMGEEFGENKHKKTNQPNKLQWSLLENEPNRNLFEYYKGLIALRKQTPALLTPNIDFFGEDPESKVLAYVRWNDDGARVVVVANFSGNYLAKYQVPNFPAAGKWHEWTNNYDLEAGEDNLVIDLSEYEAKVLVC